MLLLLPFCYWEKELLLLDKYVDSITLLLLGQNTLSFSASLFSSLFQSNYFYPYLSQWLIKLEMELVQVVVEQNQWLTIVESCFFIFGPVSYINILIWLHSLLQHAEGFQFLYSHRMYFRGFYKGIFA